MITLNYSPLSDDIPRVARRLKSLVEKVRRETGYERVHVIGHSMGGVVARYYVQCLGGDKRVHTVVTLGSPHSGTLPAYLVPHSVVKQMRPDSPIVRELDAPAAHCRTRMVAIWSDLDQMIIPAQRPDRASRSQCAQRFRPRWGTCPSRWTGAWCTKSAPLWRNSMSTARPWFGEPPRSAAAGPKHRRYRPRLSRSDRRRPVRETADW